MVCDLYVRQILTLWLERIRLVAVGAGTSVLAYLAGTLPRDAVVIGVSWALLTVLLFVLDKLVASGSFSPEILDAAVVDVHTT